MDEVIQKGEVLMRVAINRVIVLVAVAALLGWGLGATTEPVKIGAAVREDFGRIVFGWNNPVSYQSSVKKGRLTVRFGRPIEADFGRVTRVLGKYVKSASPGGDADSDRKNRVAMRSARA